MHVLCGFHAACLHRRLLFQIQGEFEVKTFTWRERVRTARMKMRSELPMNALRCRPHVSSTKLQNSQSHRVLLPMRYESPYNQTTSKIAAKTAKQIISLDWGMRSDETMLWDSCCLDHVLAGDLRKLQLSNLWIKLWFFSLASTNRFPGHCSSSNLGR